MGIFNFIRKRRRGSLPVTHYAEDWSPDEAQAKLDELLAQGHDVRAVNLPTGELLLVVDPVPVEPGRHAPRARGPRRRR